MFTKETIIPAWKMAISKRKINQKLIFHSDRGIQYASHKFRNILSLNKHVYQSMSRKVTAGTTQWRRVSLNHLNQN